MTFDKATWRTLDVECFACRKATQAEVLATDRYGLYMFAIAPPAGWFVVDSASAGDEAPGDILVACSRQCAERTGSS